MAVEKKGYDGWIPSEGCGATRGRTGRDVIISGSGQEGWSEEVVVWEGERGRGRGGEEREGRGDGGCWWWGDGAKDVGEREWNLVSDLLVMSRARCCLSMLPVEK